MDNKEIIENLMLELRRGTIVIGVLSVLSKPCYGYSLIQILLDKGMNIDAGTLYPLLRRLEKQELLKSEWETSGAKPRKYYTLSEAGVEVYKTMINEWNNLVKDMDKLISDEK